jgi:hypothetical protein
MGAMRRLLLPAALAALVLSLLACGPRPVSYGVMLWGEQKGPAASGAVVGILKVSEADNTAIIAVPGERKPREYPMGRIRAFPRKADAAAFSHSYGALLATWAFCQKQDPPPLPIRTNPRQDGQVTYRLKPGQLIKVTGRSAAKEAIRPYEDYWYEVVTEDGYAGFCFGHYLKTFEAADDPAAEARRLMSQDETLDRIMGSTWRPDWFRDSIGSGSIDLGRFREDVGLFPIPSEKTFHLVLPQYSIDFRYDRVERAAQGTYVAAGSSLRITVLDDERVSITYRYKDQEMGAVYVIVKDDVAEVIAREQKRRQDLFDTLRAKGGALTSSAYGTIRLEEGMRFTWQGFQRLVPSVIPGRTGDRGRVDFPFHVARELSADYDGVVTFVFDGEAGGSPGAGAGASFLYKAAGGGIRFTALGRESLTDQAVSRVGMSPLVIYFTQGQ